MSGRGRAVQLVLALIALSVIVWVVAGGGARIIGELVAGLFTPR